MCMRAGVAGVRGSLQPGPVANRLLLCGGRALCTLPRSHSLVHSKNTRLQLRQSNVHLRPLPLLSNGVRDLVPVALAPSCHCKPAALGLALEVRYLSSASWTSPLSPLPATLASAYRFTLRSLTARTSVPTQTPFGRPVVPTFCSPIHGGTPTGVASPTPTRSCTPARSGSLSPSHPGASTAGAVNANFIAHGFR